MGNQFGNLCCYLLSLLQKNYLSIIDKIEVKNLSIYMNSKWKMDTNNQFKKLCYYRFLRKAKITLKNNPQLDTKNNVKSLFLTICFIA